MSRDWVKKIEEIKQRLVELWQCTNTDFRENFHVPRFASGTEAQVIWGDIVKRLVIAYFIGNISAKNIKTRSRVSKL